MCVIIHKPKGVVIPDEDYRLAFENNPDGIGVMYIDDDGLLNVRHEMYDDIDTVLEWMDSLDDFNALIHFRYTTVGANIITQCHPFKVLDKSDTTDELWVMHNGTFDKVPVYSNENDTQGFIREFLKPVLSDDYSRLYDGVWIDWLDSIAGWSRLAFLTGEGDIIKVGSFYEREGADKSGTYFASNTYSFKQDHRTATTTVGTGYGFGKYTPSLGYGDDSVAYSRYWESAAYYGDDEPLSDMYTTLDTLAALSSQEVVDWVKSEPDTAYDLMLSYLGWELQDAAEKYDLLDGYDLIIYRPEIAAQLLGEYL